MAYQTGTSASMNDLIGTVLPAFASANGWTINRNTWPTQLSMSKNGCFVHLTKSTVTLTTPTPDIVDEHLFGCVGTGFDSGQTFANQPGTIVTAVPAVAQTTSANFYNAEPLGTVVSNDWRPRGTNYTAYHLFANNDYIYLVLENQPGQFTHFGFGNIDKQGMSYTGGSFVYGTEYNLDPNATNRGNVVFNDFVPFRSISGRRHFACHLGSSNSNPIRSNNAASASVNSGILPLFNFPGQQYLANSQNEHFYSQIFALGPNPVNSQTVLFPIPIFCSTTGSGNVNSYQYQGVLKDIRVCSMFGRLPGELITIGSDQYQLFPMRKLQTTTNVVNDDNSFTAGFAIRRT